MVTRTPRFSAHISSFGLVKSVCIALLPIFVANCKLGPEVEVSTLYAPSFNNGDPLSFTMDQATTLTASLHAEDLDGAPVMCAVVTPPATGTLTINAEDCEFTYTPLTYFYGTMTFVVRGYDGSQYSENATVTIVVNRVSDPPVISAVSDLSINEDTATSAIAFTITDPDDTLTCAGSMSATSSNTTIVPTAHIVIGGTAPNCTVTVTPAANQYGTPTITLNATDGVSIVPEPFVLTIVNVNDGPTISDTTNKTTNEDTATSPIAVTINDIDNTLTCAGSLSGSSNMTAIVPNANIVIGGTAPNCTVTITPATNKNSTDGVPTITLTVSDGSLSASDTFTLTITPVNDPPVISDVSNQSTNEDTATGAIAFTITDVESTLNCATSMSGSSSNTTLLPNANIVFGGTAPNCTVTLTPAANQTGTSTVTLTVSDGTATSSDTFVLTVNGVNDAPTISDTTNKTTNEDTATSSIAVTINDIDSTLTCAGSLSGSSSNTTIVPNANIVVTGTAPNCSVVITPAANQNGTPTITFTVTDGTTPVTDTFVLTVTAVNDAPTISDTTNKLTNQNTATSAIAVTINDVDNTLTCAGSLSGSSGDTTIVPNANIAIGGTAPNCTVTLTPATNQTGTLTITMSVTDGTLTATDTFDLTVVVTNTAPTISDTTNKSTNEDTASSAIALTVTDAEQTLDCASSITGSSSDTTLIPNANLVFGGTAPNCTVTITPAANLFGTSTITLTVSDGQMTASDTFVMTVNSVNDAPTISDTTNKSTNEDTATSAIAVTIADVETTLSCATHLSGTSSDTTLVPNANIVIGGTAPNCTVTITPAANQTGTATITMSVTDGSLTTTDTFDLTVSGINDAPTISDTTNKTTNEDTATSAIAVTINDVDSTLTCAGSLSGSSDMTAIVPNANIVIGGTAPNCTVTMTPAANKNSSDGVPTITLTVTDGALTASDTFTLTITPVNDVPTISDTTNKSTTEDTATSAIAVTISDIETTLVCATHLSGASSDTTLVPNANIVIGGTAPNCTVTITPAANQTGTATITMAVSDGSLTANDTFDLTVTAANDAPTISDTTNKSTNEDTATSAIAITINDVDNTLTCAGSLSGASSNTTIVPNANIVIGGTAPNCTATITPAANQNGTIVVTMTVTDGSLTATDTFDLAIAAVNDAPVISNVSDQSTNEDTATGAIAFTISDVDNTLNCVSSMTATSSNTTVAPNGNLALGGTAPNCTITITPGAEQHGTSTITLQVDDGALTASDTFVLTVNDVSDPPVISDVVDLSTNEDTATSALAFTITDADSTLNCGTSMSGSSSNTTIVPNANIVFGGTAPNCTVTVTPAANQNGAVNMTITVTDGTTPVSDVFALTVVAVNDAPTISNVSDQSTTEDTSTGAVAVTIADVDNTLTCASSLAKSSSDTTLLPNANIVVGGTAPNCTITMTPAANLSGTSTVTLTVSDGTLTAQDTFVLTVTTVNDAPVISDVADRTINEDANTGAVSFTITDVESALSCATSMSGSSSDTTIVPNANIVFGGTAPNCTVTVTPAANQNGTPTITLTVSDGTTTASDTFVLTVTAVNDAPTISDTTNKSTNEGVATSAIAVTVADVDNTLVCGSSLTGSSSNTTLVPNANIVMGGTAPNCTVTITPAATGYGTSTITLTISDGTLTASDTFVLTVTDVTAPSAPTITSSNPVSPGAATSNIPKFIGSAEAGSTVKLYWTSDCSGTPKVTGTAAAFASPGLAITFTDGEQKTVYATATDASSNVSACSSGFVFDEIGAASSTTSSISTSHASRKADGSEAATLTITLKDVSGTALNNNAVAYSSGSPGLGGTTACNNTNSSGISNNCTVTSTIAQTIQVTISTPAQLNGVLNAAITFTCPTNNGAGYSGGDGSSGTPYLVCTTTHFNNIATTETGTPGKYYKLISNLDFNGVTPAPPDPAVGFAGQFDGNYLSISNYALTDVSGNGVAFMGYLLSTAVVKNLTLASPQMTSSLGGYAGGIAVQTDAGSLIDTVYVDGAVLNCTTGACGGIAGYNGGTISNASVTNATVNITTSGYGAGVVALNYGTIDSVQVSGNLYVNGADGTIPIMGGFVAQNMPTGSISNSYVDVSGSGPNKEIVWGRNSVGGFAGINNGAITTSYVTSCGGSLVRCARGACGGFVGGTSSNSAANASITQSHSEINVTGGYNGVGGFAGNITASSTGTSTVSRSYSNGYITALTQASTNTYLGGFVGNHSGANAIAQNNWTTSSIEAGDGTATYGGDLLIGGFAGQSAGTPTFTHNFSANSEKHSDGANKLVVGGFTGSGNGIPSQNYFDSDSFAGYKDGDTEAAGNAIGHDKATMQSATTFSGDWDFDTIWTIDDGSSYPYFR